MNTDKSPVQRRWTGMKRLGDAVFAGTGVFLLSVVPAVFLGALLLNLIVNDIDDQNLGIVAFSLVIASAFAAGAGVGAYVFASSPKRPRPGDETRSAAGVAAIVAVLVAVGLTGVGLIVLLLAIPAALIGRWLGNQKHLKRYPPQSPPTSSTSAVGPAADEPTDRFLRYRQHEVSEDDGPGLEVP